MRKVNAILFFFSCWVWSKTGDIWEKVICRESSDITSWIKDTGRPTKMPSIKHYCSSNAGKVFTQPGKANLLGKCASWIRVLVGTYCPLLSHPRQSVTVHDIRATKRLLTVCSLRLSVGSRMDVGRGSLLWHFSPSGAVVATAAMIRAKELFRGV